MNFKTHTLGVLIEESVARIYYLGLSSYFMKRMDNFQ